MLLEQIDDLEARRREQPPSRLRRAAPRPAPLRAARRLFVEAGGVAVHPTVDQRRQEVHAVVGLVADQVEVVELHRSAVLDDRRRRAADGGDPLGQLGCVADRGRQAHQPHPSREVDDHLLPHRPAVGVLQEVHLVEHDDRESIECRAARVDHVAQHLGGHHDHRRVAVDRVVAGEQPDVLRTEPRHEIVVLLVRQRLDRCRVERPIAVGDRDVDGVLGDDGLAAAGRRGDEHRLPLVERVEGAQLEVVERKAVVGDQLGPACVHDPIVSVGGRLGGALASLDDQADHDRDHVEDRPSESPAPSSSTGRRWG